MKKVTFDLNTTPPPPSPHPHPHLHEQDEYGLKPMDLSDDDVRYAKNDIEPDNNLDILSRKFVFAKRTPREQPLPENNRSLLDLWSNNSN